MLLPLLCCAVRMFADNVLSVFMCGRMRLSLSCVTLPLYSLHEALCIRFGGLLLITLCVMSLCCSSSSFHGGFFFFRFRACLEITVVL